MNVSQTLKLLMMCGLSFAILMRALLKLNHLVWTLIIGNIKLFLRKLESLDDCLARFESIVSNLRAFCPLTYTDNECAKQLLYAPDDHVWGIKITALAESADLATLDTKNCLANLSLMNCLAKVILIMMLSLPIKI
jgi:hypothetical protein